MIKMKRAGFILSIFIIFFVSCKTKPQAPRSAETPIADSIIKYSPTDRDSLMVLIVDDDTLRFTKDEYGEILTKHSELCNDYTSSPDLSYYMNDDGMFGSEAGQDTYYVLYAWFLRQKNGVEEYAGRRENLIHLFNEINSLFSRINHGGTYFGHQYSRIPGYAEYAVSFYKFCDDKTEKTCEITAQKKKYIKSLRQLISDKVENDDMLLPEQKSGQIKELNRIVDDIEKRITGLFYLMEAQRFHYEHYNY